MAEEKDVGLREPKFGTDEYFCPEVVDGVCMCEPEEQTTSARAELLTGILMLNEKVEVTRLEREGLEHELLNLDLNELVELGAVIVTGEGAELTQKGERWFYRLRGVYDDHYIVTKDDIPF